MKLVIVIVILALIGGGAYLLLGKGSTPHGQGIPAGAQVIGIADITSHGKTMAGKEVTVKGKMNQKCPTAGCWFYVKDSTGEIRVDTAPSGFTITDIPLGKTVTVHGKVIVTEEGNAEMVASGVK